MSPARNAATPVARSIAPVLKSKLTAPSKTRWLAPGSAAVTRFS
jgi:hypothetical protein